MEKRIYSSRMAKYVICLFIIGWGFTLPLHSQTLTISSSGETGTSGTNWTTEGTNPVTIQTSGDANINSSVITGYLNNGTSVTLNTALDIRFSESIVKSSGGAATLTCNAGRDIFLQANISSSSNALSLLLNADSDNNASGAITLSSNLTSNGGNITFNDDLTINGSSAQTIQAVSGNINFEGEVMLSNNSGTTITTENANIRFKKAVNSGNSYSLDATTRTWLDAYNQYKSANQYLATITSQMELAAVMAVVPAGGAWLGGSDQETEGVWKWVTGPETGRIFWTTVLPTGARGYTGTNGSYVNWNTGEPNDSGGNEDALQIRNNTDGFWNDLPTEVTLLASVIETELPPSPLTIETGTTSGAVAFDSEVGAGKPLKSLNITAKNIHINGGKVITDSKSSSGGQIYTGDIYLNNANTSLVMLDTPTDFTVPTGKSINKAFNDGAANLTIKTTASIILAGSSIASTSGTLNVILWPDTDGNGGYFRMNEGSQIVTNNGHLWIGGGSGSTTWNGLTVGDGYAVNPAGTGIQLSSAVIETGSGHLWLAGKSTASSSSSHGIFLEASSLISGVGAIRLLGSGGTATGNAANCDGLRIEGTVSSTIGSIDLTGISNYENQSEGIAVESNGQIISTSGNIILKSDIIYFGGTVSQAQSSGELFLTPYTDSATIGIAGGDGTLKMPANFFTTKLADGFSQITIGSPAHLGDININTIGFRDNMRLQTSGKVVVNANQIITLPNGVRMQVDNDLLMGNNAKIDVQGH